MMESGISLSSNICRDVTVSLSAISLKTFRPDTVRLRVLRGIARIHVRRRGVDGICQIRVHFWP